MNNCVSPAQLRPIFLSLALIITLSVTACQSVPDIRPDFMKANEESKIDETDQDNRISVLQFANELEPDPELAGLAPEISDNIISTSWNQPGGNALNAPHYIDAQAPFEPIWRKKIGQGSKNTSRVSALPLVYGSMVYAMDAQHLINALNLEDGALIWEISLAPKKRRKRGAVGGGIALYQGQLFAATGYREVVAMDASTGSILWRKNFEAPFTTAPTVRDGRVFVNSNDNELFALDVNNGDVLWTLQSIAEPARILTATSPAVTEEVVIAPFASGELAAIFVENGQRAWTENLGRMSRITSLATISDIPGRPVVHGGLVFAASHAGDIAAVELRSGRVVWRREFGSVNTPWISGKTLFAINTKAQLAAINGADGRVFWVTQLPLYKNEKREKGRVAWFGPILAGGHLIMTSSLGEMAEANPINGEIISKRKMGKGFFLPPAAGESTVFLLDDEAKLIAVR